MRVLARPYASAVGGAVSSAQYNASTGVLSVVWRPNLGEFVGEKGRDRREVAPSEGTLTEIYCNEEISYPRGMQVMRDSVVLAESSHSRSDVA